MSAEPVFVTGGTGYIGRRPPVCRIVDVPGIRAARKSG